MSNRKDEILGYENLYFALKEVSEVAEVPGADSSLSLLYSAGYGFMGSASDEEIKHAREIAILKPGDIAISVYCIGGDGVPLCVSVSKVISWRGDRKTPKELVHLWPLEFENLEIYPERLQGVRIEDKR